MIKIFKKNNSGYTLVEVLVYLILFSILSLVLIQAMITMMRSFKETRIYGELIQGGEVMEKIGREIKQAYGINSINSNTLILNTKDENGNNKTIQFSLSNSNIQFLENGSLSGNLNTPNISVTALSFAQITTPKGKAVKTSFAIRANDDSSVHTENFYNTTVLRGDYQN